MAQDGAVHPKSALIARTAAVSARRIRTEMSWERLEARAGLLEPRFRARFQRLTRPACSTQFRAVRGHASNRVGAGR